MSVTESCRWRAGCLSLLPLPACLLGVYTMHHSGVPKLYWLTNLVVTGAGILFLWFVQSREKSFPAIFFKIAAGLSGLFLVLTFFSKDMYGVHRWVFVGGLNLNAGLITCPVLLIILHKLEGFLPALLLVASITLLLLLQPDASQVSAFSISASVLLGSYCIRLWQKCMLVLFLLAVNVYTWAHLDSLEPVSYVERIVYLAGRIDSYHQYVAFVALAILVIPFFTEYLINGRLLYFSLGIYYTLTIVSAFAGNFPVIVMGYGISPIVGYFIGLCWLMSKKHRRLP